MFQLICHFTGLSDWFRPNSMLWPCPNYSDTFIFIFIFKWCDSQLHLSFSSFYSYLAPA